MNYPANYYLHFIYLNGKLRFKVGSFVFMNDIFLGLDELKEKVIADLSENNIDTAFVEASKEIELTFDKIKDFSKILKKEVLILRLEISRILQIF